MKKIILFSLLLNSFNISAKLCDVGQFAELEPIADAPFEAHKKCLKSLAEAPTTPTYPKGLFEKLGNEEVFAGHCMALSDSKDFTTFMLLTSKGLKAIRFPVYHFMVGTQSASLPGDITHFKYEGKDYYVQPHYGEARIFTKDQLPAVAEELMISMSKVHSKIIKYEDYLKSVNRLSEINVNSDPNEIKKVLPCLANIQQNTVKLYVRGKFGTDMPAYSTIMDDYNKFQDLDEETRKKYLVPFEDRKKAVMADLVASHPVCDGIIDQASVEKAFEDSWGKNKQYYELIRQRFVSP